ncbi:MAG: argininosuccinate lyase [Gammaproteobacteria bacterium]|nr:argininosuccinate lyase [Gammaproteobacteria bacterium]MBI5618926.1 argininosuccinate lyase [Gammaproteobacteria bacterium]
MSDSSPPEKLWGGRFTGPTDAFVEAFTASVAFDQRLYAQDIRGSIAHATMLAAVGILTGEERDRIVAGLTAIEADIDAGRFTWSIAREDVHMNVEAALVERIGEVGKKLHTARSRNDQVATDIRLYLRDQIDGILAQLVRLETALVELAEREAETVLPGFTHLQAAQPVSFGHHMLAWFEMLERDRERLRDCRKRVNVLPLGAGALAGTTFPIDRELTARLLDFDGVADNSLDAVSDRDFAIEFAACASLLMVHFSRMAEELVLWNSQQFAFVDLDDAFCTGSSMMPQKKNPDVPELVRGKSGRVVGHLMSLIVLMKSQPLAYNKDNQEDKEPLFDTVDTVRDCLKAFGDLVPTLKVRRERMRQAARAGFTTATDFADYLVRRGIPFRDAHAVVGQAVKLAVERGCDLQDLTLADYQALAPQIDNEVFAALDVGASLNARNHRGGTAPAQVRAAAARARTRLASA